MAFGLRVAALGIPASAWWAGPVLVQTLYGIDFLQFTEQPGAIWASTSLSESFRLMGYWPSYLGVGYGSLLPFYETSPDLLFSAPVVVATLLVPALAVAGFAAGAAVGLRAVLPGPAAAGAAGHDRRLPRGDAACARA